MKYPIIYQEGIKDCAAACVLMILKYYGGYVSINKLCEMLETDITGTTAYNIILTLENLGFKACGLKKDNFNFDLPAIAHLKIDNSYMHYVVIYEVNFKHKYLVVSDPIKGIKRVKILDFKKMWTGIVITMKPVKTLPLEKEIKVKDFLFKLIKLNKKNIIIISLMSLIISILSVLSSFFFQIIFNNINKDIIFKISGIFFFIFLFKSLLEYICSNYLIKLNNNIDRFISLDTFKSITYLPYPFFRRKTTGEILSYFNDLIWIRDFIGKLSLSFLTVIPTILFSFFILLYLDFNVCFLNIFICFIYFIIYFSYKKKGEVLNDLVLEGKSDQTSYMTESIMGFETVKNLDLEKKFILKFKGKYDNYLKKVTKLNRYYNKFNLENNFINYFGMFILFIYGFMCIKSGMSIGKFITIFILSSFILDNFLVILNFGMDFKKVKSCIKHINGLLDYNFLKKKRKRLTGDIEFKNVSYKFGNVYVVNNINLKIKEKEKVMVIGTSGSGKSTLFKILKGLYPNYEGDILISGKNILKYMPKISYISQNEILFTGTLEDNLCLAGGKVRKLDLPIGNSDLILEDGFNLSGGQRQRIILARALNDFDILIIDEGLNQVDIDMERRILKDLFKEYSDKTIIFISHRLDNLDLFERLIKLKQGKVVLDEVRM